MAPPVQVTHALENDSNKVPAISFTHRHIQSAASSWRQELFWGSWTFLCAWGLAQKQDQIWTHRAGGRFCRNTTHQPVCAEEQPPQGRSVSSSCIKGLWYFALWVRLTPPSFLHFPACVRTKVTSASYGRCPSLQVWRWCIHVVTHRNNFRINTSDISSPDQDVELGPLHEHRHSEEPHSQQDCKTRLIIRGSFTRIFLQVENLSRLSDHADERIMQL